MVIEMNEGKHVTWAQVRAFLAGTADVGIKALLEDGERYRWIAPVLGRLGYRRLSAPIEDWCCATLSGCRVTRASR